jgi:hypothetical protein
MTLHSYHRQQICWRVVSPAAEESSYLGKIWPKALYRQHVTLSLDYFEQSGYRFIHSAIA